jgi:4-amino-4-deoxy-L-arabinose transferase-like glycosyltransferase
MKNKITLLLLIIFVVIGATLRFFKLGEIPDSLNWDEVSWGYNGYSIWQTGRDEHGELFPLSFKAFGDYKQPVYVYLNALSIGLFGLNAFAVRFPSAFLGVLSIIITYLLVKELRSANTVALISAGLVAVSPWSIQFSRIAYEANVGQFFVLLGVWLFVKGLNMKNWILLCVSTIPLAISSYTYHSEKIFTPILFGGLVVFGFPFFIQHIKKALLVILLFIVLILPWVIDSRTTARGRSVTFLSNQTQLLTNSIEKLHYEQEQELFLGKLFYNRRIVYFTKYIDNYLAHFDPNFLFVKGDDARHHAPGMGVLYIVSLPFIIAGMIVLLRLKSKETFLIFLWFFLAPVAAALAINAPNASRSLIILPTWQLFGALGIVQIVNLINKSQHMRLAIIAIAILYSANILYFIHQYFVHTNTDMQQYWQYGYEQAVKFVHTQTLSKNIHFDESIEQGYIFYLFHTAYPPEEYMRKGLTFVSSDCYALDAIKFGSCKDLVYQPGDLLITRHQDYDAKFLPLAVFPTQDKQVTISVLEYGKQSSIAHF